MKSLRFNLFALAALALAITPSLVFGQNDTGTAGIGNPGGLDPYYTLVVPGLLPGPVFGAPPVPGWVLPVPGSNWINHDGFDNFFAPAGVYDYETVFAFALPVYIEGEFAADNFASLKVKKARNKFVLLGSTPPLGFGQYTHFVIPKNDVLRPTTTLEFQVTNLASSAGGFSWTGLEVAFFCPPSLGPAILPTYLGLYSDGGASASVNAWTINNGYVVSDTFGTATSGVTVTGFCFFAWVNPVTDVPNTVDWSITSAENGGTYYGDGTAPLTCALYCTSGQMNPRSSRPPRVANAASA